MNQTWLLFGGIGAILILASLVGAVLRWKAPLGMSVALTAMYGFPADYLLTNEYSAAVIEAIAELGHEWIGAHEAYLCALLDDGLAEIDGVRPLHPGRKLVGTAKTLRFVPFREDLFTTHGGGYNAQKRLFDSLRPDDVVVIDKPVGVAAHPASGWDGPTVLGALAGAGYRIATSGASERQGIVQRLDVGTSGLMVVAKSEYAYSVLKRAFKERTVEKTYHAVVQGLPDPVLGTIDAPIARHPKHDGLYAVRTEGKNAITHYEVIEAHRRAALVEIHLETGRTHQIRVHMAAVGHPCVGDATYGADPAMSARTGIAEIRISTTRVCFSSTTDCAIVEPNIEADIRNTIPNPIATK